MRVFMKDIQGAIAVFCTIYNLLLFPLVYYIFVNIKLEKKIGVKISSNIKIPANIIFPKVADFYFGVPCAVTFYITIKSFLKTFGCDVNKIKIGNSTLQKINYELEKFTTVEIMVSIWHFFVMALSFALGFFILINK